MPAKGSSASDRYDAVIAGGGHNGLVCAAYLARAGLRVKVLERRNIVGGAAVTEEFHPGFRNSVCSYTVSLLNPKVIADLDLRGHGLEIIERPAMNFLPLPDGDYLLTGNGRTKEDIAKFSPRDAQRYDDYCAHLERLADALLAGPDDSAQTEPIQSEVPVEHSEVRPEKIEEALQRIEKGYYDRDDVIESLVQMLLG